MPPDRKTVVPNPFAGDGARVHFTGVGGSGMSPLAELALARGLRVSGTDMADSPVLSRLSRLGATIAAGHDPNMVRHVDMVIRSSAVSDDNPELEEARRLGVPVLGRAGFLALAMEGYEGIACAGTHGKTTSTAIMAAMMEGLGWDATVVVGGRPMGWPGNLRIGQGRRFLVEADESDGSFLCLRCRAVLVTGIDDDHLENHSGMDGLVHNFLRFIDSVGREGAAVLCRDDEILRSAFPRIRVPFVTYGSSPLADYRIGDVRLEGLRTVFDLVLPSGETLESLVVNGPGRHFAFNAAGCLALLHVLGADPSAAARGLSLFSGVARRFQVKGEASGVTVVDDYAHHPTELKAVLAAARNMAPDRRVVAIFQPHRLSRTERLVDSLAGAFGDADVVCLLPVYSPAGDLGCRSRRECTDELYEKTCAAHPCVVLLEEDDMSSVAAPAAALLRPGDLVLTLGAGTVTELGDMLLERIGGGAG